MPANFHKIDSLEFLDELFAASMKRPIVIFKHSGRCGTSSHMLEEIGAVEGDIYYVVVQDARDISEAIAIRTGFRHHTPQVFVIRDGAAAYHATHYSIDPRKIEDAKSRRNEAIGR
jgi:bacillithiol system protein YtxJ